MKTEQATPPPFKSIEQDRFLDALATTAFVLVFGGYFLIFCLMVIRSLMVPDFALPAITWVAWAVIIGGAPIALLTRVGKTYQFRAYWVQSLLLIGVVFGMLNTGMVALTLFNLPLIATFGLIFFSRRAAFAQLGIALGIIACFTIAKYSGVLTPIDNADFWLNSDYRWGLRGAYLTVFSVAVAYFLDRYVTHALDNVEDLAILQEAIDEAPDAFVVWDDDDRLFTSNLRYRNLEPGLKPHLVKGVTFEETLRVGLQLGMYPEAKGREDDWVQDRIRLHQASESSRVLQLGDGRWMRILESRTSSGFLAGFRTDITELRAIEDLLKATLDSVTEAIITLSADYRVRNINAASVRIFGLEPQEIIGKTIWEINPEASAESLEKLAEARQKLDGNAPLNLSVTTTLQRKGGQTFAARVEMTALKLGSETVFVLAVVDLTEKRIYEGNSEALGAALEQLDVGFVLFNELDEAQFINQRFIQLLGPFRAPVNLQLGGHITELLTSVTQATTDLRLSNDQSSPYRGLLKFYYDPRGRLDLTLHGRRLLLAGQKLEGGYTSLRLTDVTETVEQAAQLEQATKLATLGEMAAGIAHELNQPLQAIKLTAAVALRRLTTDPEKAKATTATKLEQIIQQIDRAAVITDHMRKSARLATEEAARANILDVIENAHLLVESSLRLNSIEWRKALPASLPECQIHPIRLEQVLLNLFNNARDAIVEGRQNRGEHRWLNVTAGQKNAALVELKVEDSAGGIPPAVINRVFDPFYTTKAVGKGTGLGLSISYQIIKEAGGALTVTNTQYGAQFVITLPVNQDGRQVS